MYEEQKLKNKSRWTQEYQKPFKDIRELLSAPEFLVMLTINDKF